MPDLPPPNNAEALAESHERDYLERTIETVRNHRDADNCWPQWANIFADEIERLWQCEAELVALGNRAEQAEKNKVRAIEIAADMEAERNRWLEWSGGRYPDDSPGDVIHAYSDGTIVLDDSITTWNPLRALEWIEQQRETADALAASERAEEQ